jgi:ribosomal protein S18 acetylase RimI-like enzyme
MTYEIFRLQARDFKKCGNIWNMKTHRKRWRRWRREVRSGKRATFIYAERGAYLGEGSLVFGDETRVCLSRLVVKQEAQGRGIGGILLEYLCDEAIRMGYREISLEVNLVNARARHLYEKHGFEVIGEGEDRYGKYLKMLKYLEQMS